jgi:formyl-CoA transferase/CoA:oxalate CoA-transferase
MTGPLTGIRVLDLSRALAGPFCTQLMGDMGAEIIKVEPSPDGDDSRRWGPFWNEQSCYYLSTNRNKQSIVIDLKNPAGLRVARQLADKSDVVIENFRPGVVERLGLGYDSLAATNPRLVYCSISGFGQDGPRANDPAYDLAMQGFAGLMGITGYPGMAPVRAGLPVADFGTALFAAVGILAALLRRQETGVGQKVETSLLEGQLSWFACYVLQYLADGTIPERMGSSHHFITPYQAFATLDGYFILAVGNDVQWQRLCQAMAVPELAQDSRFATNVGRLAHRAELLPTLETLFSRHPTEDLIQTLMQAGVPCGPVNTVDKLVADPQVVHLDAIPAVPHPEIPDLRLPAVPLRFSSDRAENCEPPPLLGQQTDEILTELGYSPDQITALRRDGAIR